jgi:hypothetical protein
MAVGKDGALAPVGRKRRSWKRDEKLQIVEESLQDGASIAEVALSALSALAAAFVATVMAATAIEAMGEAVAGTSR